MNSGTFLAVLVLPPLPAKPGDPRFPAIRRPPAAAPSRRGPAKSRGRHLPDRAAA